MYLTVHAATALVAARAVPNPAIALVVGLLSHLVLDFIPHGDEQLTQGLEQSRVLWRLAAVAALDSAMLFFFLWYYLSLNPTLNLGTAAASLVGALLPDVLLGLNLIRRIGWLEPITRWHLAVHNPTGYQLGVVAGLLLQTFTLLGLWLILLRT